MTRLRRLICRVRGHKWGPWFQWQQWRRFDDITDHWHRSCWRCHHFEVQEDKP